MIIPCTKCAYETGLDTYEIAQYAILFSNSPAELNTSKKFILKD